MTATATNGPARRKQLSDQLDRLDGIIDGLCDGLPRAVAEATREGARQAVRDVLVEVLTNPDLRALIAGAAPPAPEPTAPRASFWAEAQAGLAAAKAAVAARCKAAAAAVGSAARALAAAVPLRQVLLVGAGVGAALGLVRSAGRHAVSAVAGTIRRACAAAAARVGAFLREPVRVLGFAGMG